MEDQELNLAIGQRLRVVRTSRGLTQGDLAAHLGVVFQQIQKYENGTNRLSVAVMLRLCKFMDVDPGIFVNGVDAPEIVPTVNGGVKTGHGAEQKSATAAPA